jgi:hypothetical protein
MTWSLSALTRGRRWLAFGLLAGAIGFKLAPLVWLPLWIIGAAPISAWQAWRDGRRGPLLRATAGLGLILVLLTLATMVPFLIQDGSGALGFWEYHRTRGFELGCVPSTLLMLAVPLGWPVEVYHSHGSVNVRSDLAPILLTGVTWGLPLLLLAVFIWILRRLARAYTPGQNRGGFVAEQFPGQLIAGATLLLLVFISGNKVFSPQYLIWLVPLVSLLPYRPPRGRVIWGLFLFTCLLTSILYLWLFGQEVAGAVMLPDGEGYYTGPTPLGVALIAFRNALVILLLVLLMRWEPNSGEVDRVIPASRL